MCGRYSLSLPSSVLEEVLGVEVPESYSPSYNIAPTQLAWVLVQKDQQAALMPMRWGMVPHWSKDGKPNARLINARAEGISSKPSFRMPVRKHRCLIPADSFYEWRTVGKEKWPYRILPRQGEIMMMAGIYDIWQKHDERTVSFSIITTTPNKEINTLHNRMPVILSSPDEQSGWLTEPNLTIALSLLQPLPDNSLQFYPVSKSVNKPSHNMPSLHEPIDEAPPMQPSLFDGAN